MNTALAAGKRYTLIVVGTYPNYSVLTFEEPASGRERPTLALRSVADRAQRRVRQLPRFEPFGLQSTRERETRKRRDGFAGRERFELRRLRRSGSKPFTGGDLTLAGVNAFDKRNALPFHNASRFSLFLFDAKSGSASGPVFGSLDQ